MEFIRLPMSTKKRIQSHFNGLEPNKYYKPLEELGNYQWHFFSQKIASTEDLRIAAKEIAPSIVKKMPRLFLDDTKVISFKEFRSFLTMNYKGWAPCAKGMSEEKATIYADKLIESFLSCSPENAIYVKFGIEDKSCFAEIESFDVPILLSGVIGIVDTENMEYFKLVIGGYDSYNAPCCKEIGSLTIPRISFCPIRKIPIEFNAFNPSLINQDRIEELGNYLWYLYQFRIKDGDISIEHLQKDEQFRNLIPPVGKFKSSLVVSHKDFLSFLVTNYKGWAPYAKGMSEEKATIYADKLIESFLSCSLNEAIYLKYEGWKEIENPYLISGVMCVLDQKNNEFFELIMGGTD